MKIIFFFLILLHIFSFVNENFFNLHKNLKTLEKSMFIFTKNAKFSFFILFFENYFHFSG